jgi:hypothetical protein
LNLSNEPFGFFQGSAIYPIQREFCRADGSVRHALVIVIGIGPEVASLKVAE